MRGLEALYVNGCKSISSRLIAEIALQRSTPHIISEKRSDQATAKTLNLQEELIKNGGFDQAKINVPFITCNAGETTIKDWSVLRGSVDLIQCFKASSGKNYIDLNGFQTQGEITQSIGTVSGGKYLLQFDATSHPDTADLSKSFLVRIGDISKTFSIPYLGNTRSNMNWEHFELPFIAKSAQTKIIFESLSPSDQGACLDSVSVRKQGN